MRAPPVAPEAPPVAPEAPARKAEIAFHPTPDLRFCTFGAKSDKMTHRRIFYGNFSKSQEIGNADFLRKFC